jgi:hypothetical protein
MKEWLRKMARIYLPVYKFQSDDLKFIYAGYSPIKKSYYARLFLGKEYEQKYLGRYWYSTVPGLTRTKDIDLIITEISTVTYNYFRDSKGFILPVWTPMRIKIVHDIDVFFKGSDNFLAIIRRIKKYNLTCETLTDYDSFRVFNDRYYQPYMANRHGEEAFVEDLEEMWKTASQPMILAVKEGDVIAGMALIKKSGNLLLFLRLGLIDGNEEYLKHGVIGAFYYFGMKEAQRLGCSHVDLGGTRPFLTDGLTRYKSSLGGEFIMDLSPTKEYLWFGVNEHSESARNFLSHNPFMFVNNEFKLEKHGS